MSRFSYLGQDEEADEEPKQFEKIPRKPKPSFDDKTSPKKKDTKKRRSKKRR